MTTWKLGTVGFGYQEWVGSFYPPGMRSEAFLSHYSAFFDAAELDTTFYGIPGEAAVLAWRDKMPPGFVFCPKAPRAVTHELQRAETAVVMGAFVERLQLLGDKLGPVLIQFPPSFTFDAFGRLIAFLGQLPEGPRYAVEFRHPSWRRRRVLDLLQRDHVAWVAADYIHLPPELLITAPFTYLRFIGEHGRFTDKSREQLDPTERLTHWREQLLPHLARLDAVYGFFNNDFSGHSPATCNRFKQMFGLPTAYPDIPSQPTLF